MAETNLIAVIIFINQPPERPQSSIDLANLRQLLSETFNLSELRDLCFDLGIEFDGLLGNTIILRKIRGSLLIDSPEFCMKSYIKRRI